MIPSRMRRRAARWLACGLPWLAAHAAGGADDLAIARALVDAQVPARDDPDAIARRLLETAAAHADSPATALLVLETRGRIEVLQDPAACLRLLDAFLAAAPNGFGAYEAARLKADLLRRSGDLDGAREAGAHERHVGALLAIGPFGDGGDYYTGTPFAPELRFPGRGQQLMGRYGPVEVRLAERRPLHRTIDLSPPGEARTGCFYGLHQVVAEADTSCWVEVSCRGSFELFVNGRRLAAVDRHAVRLPTELRFAVALPRGLSHVLVKTTLNDYHDVGMRYVDAAGRPVPGLREADDPTVVHPPVAPATPATGDLAEPLDALMGAAAAARGEERTVLLLAAARSALELGDFDDGMRLLQELEADPPSSGIPAIAFAEVLENATPLPEEIRRGRARTLVEAQAEALEGHHHVVLQRARYLADQDKREDAVRLLEAEIAAGRGGPATFDELHGLLTGLRFAAEARRVRQQWRAALPLDVRPVLADVTERARAGDARGALALALEAEARIPHEGLRRRALELATDLGEAETAQRLVDRLHALEPERLTALQDRAFVRERLGDDERAAALWQRVATHAEADARQLRTAGDHLLRSGHEDDALAAYERALALDPSQHELHRLLDRLRGKAELARIARFRRDGDAIIAGFAPGEREQGASSSLVLDQMIVLVRRDGSVVEETHQIRRVNDLRGVERYQEAEDAAHADEIVRLRTVGTDGLSYVPSRVAGSFGMPRLEPGAFIEEIYRNHRKSPGAEPWRATSFFFRGTDEPYVLSELVVIVPPNAPGTFRTRRFDGVAEVVELDDGFRAHLFRKTDVPRLPTERNAPPLEEVMPIVTWGEDGDADANARLYRTNAGYRAYTTPLVAAKADEVVAGCETDLAKARAIHRFVHAEIASGDATTDPTAMLLQRSGHRFFLEVAMLAHVGVPLCHAAVAPAREELDAAATPLFLGTEEYPVPAALVAPAGEEPSWLFADTPRYAPLGFVPYERLGAPALLLAGERAELTRLPSGRPETLAGFEIEARVTLEADGGAAMAASARLRGANGYDGAEQLRTAEENVQQVVARRVVGSLFPGWALREVSLPDLAEPGRQLTARAALHRGRALEPAGGALLLNLPLGKTQFLQRWGDRGTRTLPLRLTDLTPSSWQVVVDPGESYRFAEIPPPLRVRHMLLDFNLTFTRDGEKLVVRREVVQRPGEIPAAQFAEWLDLLRRLDLAEDVNLKLVTR